MMSREIRERIIAVLKNEFPRIEDFSGIEKDGDLISALDLDSQSLLNLLLALESEFKIRIDEAALQIEDVNSLAALTRTVRNVLRASGQDQFDESSRH